MAFAGCTHYVLHLILNEENAAEIRPSLHVLSVPAWIPLLPPKLFLRERLRNFIWEGLRELLLSHIKRRQFGWFGHLTRSHPGRRPLGQTEATLEGSPHYPAGELESVVEEEL